MSGGRFDYKQYHIGEIADEIERELKEEEHIEPEVKKKMRKAVKVLRQAHVYAQRTDWYLSGDDGCEQFLKRLADELGAIK